MQSIRSFVLRAFVRLLPLLVLVGVQATAGEVPLFAVGNRVWYDTDNSGTINNAETGIDGVKVDLYAANDLTTIVATTTTANGGYYLFGSLQAGNYVVSIAASNFAGILQGYWSSGTSRTNAGVITETAAPAANSDIDLDDNGTRQSAGPLTGAVVSSVITLGPGPTSEPVGETDLDNGNQGPLDAQANMTVDFGFYTMELGNLVWNDLDNSGTLDAGEPGLADVTVELWSADGSSMLATTTTGAGGNYLFTGLAAGSYVVRLPAGNFNPAGVLRDYRSSTGPLPALADEPGPNPNTNHTDSDDNGSEANGLLGLGGYIQALPITLTPGQQQSAANATGKTSELRLDFGVQNLPAIDLTVTITDGQAAYTPGTTLNYVVVVTNHGPADADGMTVSNARPPQIASWTWTCAPGTPAGYNCSGDNTNPATFTDSLDLPQLASVTYNVVAQVAADATGSLTSTVVVTPPVGIVDLTPLDNIAADVDTRSTLIDVGATITDNQTNYAPGATVNYVVTVTNNGPGSAIGTSVSATRAAQFTSWTWTCAVATPPAYNCTGNLGNPPTFTDSLDLPQGASVTYNVTAQVAALVSGNLVQSVTATAPAGFNDVNPVNDQASDTDALVTTTLAVTKTAGPNPVSLGGLLTYTIQVTNTGAVNATGVVIVDALPGALLFESASGSGWNCGASAGVVTCTRDLLAPGAAPPIVITATATSASTVVNTVIANAVNASQAATASAEALVVVQAVPTLNAWTLLILGLLLAGTTGALTRRR